MTGYIEKHGKYWRVQFYHGGKKAWLTHYDDRPCWTRELAEKLKRRAQEDVEAEAKGEGVFRWERYTNQSIDTIKYLYDWLEISRPHIAENTYLSRTWAIKKHLEPFFRIHSVSLRKINHTLLYTLLNSLTLPAGKSKKEVLGTLRSCLDFAWRDQRISGIPPFPRKADYKIQKPVIIWLPEERQLKVIDAMPKKHQSIYAWCKWHYRRPSEGMALGKDDFDGSIFTIRKGISGGSLVEHTKTYKEFNVPCANEYKPYLKTLIKGFSNYFFINPEAVNKEMRYIMVSMRRIWNRACEKTGETIPLYQGLKHSSCCQFINEKGGNIVELADITGQSIESLQCYAVTETAKKKELMGRKVVGIKKEAKGV